MMPDIATVLSAGVAIGVAIMVIALLLPLVAILRARRRRILNRLAGGTDREALRRAPPAPAGLRRADYSLTRGQARRFDPLAPLRRLQRGLSRRMLVIFVLSTLTLGLLARFFVGLGLGPGLAAGAVLSVFVAVMLQRRHRRKRLELIAAKVPEALDMIVRSLRIGSPVNASIQVVGREMSGPISEEFATTAQEISYGKDTVTALQELAERCNSQDLRFLATAVGIQTAAGGNLAEVLERLAQITRGRFQLQRKVTAITSEARWSGNFLSAFPVIAGAALLAINPGYFSNITDKSFFVPLVVVIVVFMIANILFMRSMVNIRP